MRSSLFVVLFAGALALPQAQAGENFNYSAVQLIGGWTEEDISLGQSQDLKIDGSTFGLAVSYELPAAPVVFRGAYSKGSVDDDELPPGASIDAHNYQVGVSYIFSQAPGFDLLPGLSFGQTKQTIEAGTTIKNDTDLFGASLLARYGFNNDLVLNGGIAYWEPGDEGIDSITEYRIGAEYQADEKLSIGIDRNWTTDLGSTLLFAKFFF